MTSLRAALALTALLALTGCGDDGPPASTAAPTASTGPVASPDPEVSESAERLTGARLTGDGVDLGDVGLLLFGADVAEAEPQLVTALGPPTADSGEIESFSAYGTCPGTRLRALEYGDGALVLLFGDVIGPGLTLYQWSLTADGDPLEVPPASALVGDTATLELRVGTPLGELREGAATDTLTVLEGDERLAPSFELADQSSGLRGMLAGTSDADAVTSVQAGEACGE